MSRTFYIMIFLTIFMSCKNSKNTEIKEDNVNQENEQINKVESFENSLLDLREVNRQLTPNFKVTKFGMEKLNDSIFNFVFKLNNETTPETIGKYSMGIRTFRSDVPTENYSYSPDIEIKNDGKYLVLRKKLKDVTYFDSLDIYVYERKNWEKSGRLGGIMIRNILFE